MANVRKEEGKTRLRFGFSNKDFIISFAAGGTVPWKMQYIKNAGFKKKIFEKVINIIQNLYSALCT